MDFLLISNIALWALVVMLSVAVYALTRQVGVLFERVAPAGALSVNKQLEVGQAAPAMSLTTLDSKLVEIAGTRASGKSQLLFFVSPDCPICKTLLPALTAAAHVERDWMELVLASDGAEQDHNGYVKRFKLRNFPYVVSEILGQSYGVAKLPYAVLIDEVGNVASMGIINSREHLDSLFEAKERGLASIQDYFSQQQEQPASGALYSEVTPKGTQP
ncbi:MAG: redoxin family protein [Porticoccaceae bacterium]